MCTPRMPSASANVRWIADVTSGKASPGAVAKTWSPTRATVADVPMRFGDDRYHGAPSERLTVKIEPGPQNHVPVPPLFAGSSPAGQPSGPPGWLHDIASRRL